MLLLGKLQLMDCSWGGSWTPQRTLWVTESKPLLLQVTTWDNPFPKAWSKNKQCKRNVNALKGSAFEHGSDLSCLAPKHFKAWAEYVQVCFCLTAYT